MNCHTRAAIVVVLAAAVFCADNQQTETSLSQNLQATVTTPSAANVSYNCTIPAPATDVFNISGLEGWELVSHDDYLSNRVSMYSHNMNCLWEIANSDQQGSVVVIKIVRLQMEAGSIVTGCKFDALQVLYLDYESNSPVNHSYCGNVREQVLLARSHVSIKFWTDGSVNHRGFHVQWALVNSTVALRVLASVPFANGSSSECSTIEDLDQVTVAGLTAPGGRLASQDLMILDEIDNYYQTGPMSPIPGYGYSTYRSNSKCQWTITSPTRYILLWIDFLQLESGRIMMGPGSRGRLNCPYDNLTLSFSNAIDGSHSRLTFCHLTMDRLLLANSTVTINFMSDASVESRGFQIRWLYLSDQQARVAMFSWNLLSNSSKAECTKAEPSLNLTLSGVGNYSGGRLLSHTEYLTTLDSSYHPNMQCNWIISPPNNSTLIHLRIVALDLESGSGNTFACRFDNLTFAFLNALTNRWEQRVACTSLHSVRFTSSGNVSIRFVTDHSVAKRGFHLEWFFVPRADMVKLPELENLQSVTCPAAQNLGSTGGLLSMIGYQPNSHCSWRWTLGDEEQMEFTINRLSLDIRDFVGYGNYMPCRSARDKLVFSYMDADGDFVTQSFCGRLQTVVKITAYTGSVEVTFVSDETTQGPGFIFVFKRRRTEIQVSDCSEIQTINSHQSKLSDRLIANQPRRCTWSIKPKDENHIVQITVKHFGTSTSPFNYYHYIPESEGAMPIWDSPSRFSSCPHKLTIRSNRTVSPSQVLSAASQVYSNQPVEPRINVGRYQRHVCSLRHSMPGIVVASELSVEQTEIRIDSMAGSPSLMYDIQIDQVPVIFRHSGGLCPEATIVSTKQSLVSRMPSSRLLSVKQLLLSSFEDCRGVAKFDSRLVRLQSMGMLQRGDMLKMSFNCSKSNGSLFILIDNALNSVACNSAAMLNWTHQQAPIIVEAEGTGGFKLLLEQIKWISDGSYRCPTYNPTNRGSWISNLPLFLFNEYYRYHHREETFYCDFRIQPPQGSDLIVELTMPQNPESMEQFCSELSTEAMQPQLNLIVTGPNEEERALSLCDHSMPGGLKMREKIRIPSDSTLTVDLIAVRKNYVFQNQSLTLGMAHGMDCLITVSKVTACSLLKQSQWKASQDRSKAQTSITVKAGNTQTDCKLQLDAAAVARVATETGILVPKDGKSGCWKLNLVMNQFETTCGQNKIMLTASLWDFKAGSATHRRREVCGSSEFSFSITMTTEDGVQTGMSLSYSEVKQGFVASFTVSACQSSISTGSQGSRVVGEGGRSTWIVIILILVSALVCVALFAYRQSIIAGVRTLVNRSRATNRLSYTTGADGVSLLNDS